MPNIIVDTSVILEGKENVEQLSKDSNVFVTDIILQELDGNKGAEGAKGYNAREFFRTLGKDKGEQCDRVPLTGKNLQQGDSLRKMSFGMTPLYVFVRKNYKTRNINDSKIIEMAKDYDMKLVTNDVAQRVRALSEGVDGDMFESFASKGEVTKMMKRYGGNQSSNGASRFSDEGEIERRLRMEREGQVPVFENTGNSFNMEAVGKTLAIIIFAIPVTIVFGLLPFGVIPAAIVVIFAIAAIAKFSASKESSSGSKIKMFYAKKEEKTRPKKSIFSSDSSISSDWQTSPFHSDLPGNIFHDS